MLRYIDILRLHGFESDADFMEAWQKDSETWADIFALRMQILSILCM